MKNIFELGGQLRAFPGLHQRLRQAGGFFHIAPLRRLCRAFQLRRVLRGNRLCRFGAAGRLKQDAELLDCLLIPCLCRQFAEDCVLIRHMFHSFLRFVYASICALAQKCECMGLHLPPDGIKYSCMNDKKGWTVLKILVFSDSHGYTAGMIEIIDREQPDGLIHLGDCTEDVRELEAIYPALPVYYIRGNNDFDRDIALNAVITPGDVPVYMTHGHKEHVTMSACGLVPRIAQQEGCKLAFFGHTHQPVLENIDGVLVCNPGSISLPRNGIPSYARLTITNNANGQAGKLEVLREDGAVLRVRTIKQK